MVTLHELDSLDGLLVLGGEDPTTRPRSKTASQVLQLMKYDQFTRIPVIASGFGRGIRDVSEAKEMATYISNTVGKHVITEQKSKDTYANMVYSAPTIQQKGIRNLGIITDDYHHNQALALANHVLGDTVKLFAISTGNTSREQNAIQNIARDAMLADLHRYDVAKGDYDAHLNFLNTVHWQHAKNPPASVHKTLFDIVS